ncbi:hypothetical protein HPB49_001097 [Dermacentor silvarum]|uniref:Uncharacterized protein n=1 Tax=Dermacentor silvarum TaxID=543639 RepID=A0ACB8DSQ0_DERSI|nr:hypothetical protein HPB49_001097 [Dermacentor silvarum]
MKRSALYAIGAFLVALCVAGIFCVILADITVGLFIIGTALTVALLFGIVWMGRTCYGGMPRRPSLSASTDEHSQPPGDSLMAIDIPPYPAPSEKAFREAHSDRADSRAVLYKSRDGAVVITKRPPVLSDSDNDYSGVYL